MSETEQSALLPEAGKSKGRKSKATDGQTHVVTFAAGHPSYKFGKIYLVDDAEAEALIAASKARLATEAEVEAMEDAGTAG